MAEKQASSLEASCKTTPENVFEMRLQDLKTNYSDTQLIELLAENGLDNMPLTSTTRNVLLKKLAQKMLSLDQYSPASPVACANATSVEITSNGLGDTEPPTSSEMSQCNNNADICKVLTEAKESLLSCLNPANKTHYVVCIPNIKNSITIHSDSRHVLKLMRDHIHQKPRMLPFSSLADAEAFASKHTANEVCQGATIKSHPQEKAEVEITEVKMFPSLTTPQLNEFRIYLEKGNISRATQCIMINPRYLIQSIDLPTILKEGTRYNALHASVIAGQLESCRLVMETLSDVEYLKRLYDTQEKAEENSMRLIDLYLNTPDKVANKTPLHLASERGYVDIVAFLVSFKVCIRNFNRHITETVTQGNMQREKVLATGETPEEVACSRYRGPNAAALKTRIVSLIQGGTCYVPLIRSDTTGPYARVGDPYTPSSPYKLVSEIEDVLRPAPTADVSSGTRDFRNMKVWAFAGPMSPTEAQYFRKKWKSPTLAKLNHSVRESHKVLDGERGFERFGRELADSHSTSWQEYWPFLDAFADLRCEDGLDKLNTFFQKQQVIYLLQALLKGEEFLSAEQYSVNKEYILLQDLSECEESEEDNEGYFSADSPSLSEEDILVTSEVCAITSETNGDTSSVTLARPSGGVFSSLWGGVIRFVNIFSLRFGRHKQNVNSLNDNSATNRENALSDESSSTTSSCSQQEESERTGMSVASPTSASRKTDDMTESQQLDRSPSADSGTQLNTQSIGVADSGNTCREDAQSVTSVTDNLSSSELTVPKETKQELPQTPDKWKYRIQANSPESDSPSPHKASPSHVISPCCDEDEIASACQTENVHRPDGSFLDSSPDKSQLDDSFNTKMDTFSNTLQNFSILSPVAAPSVPATTASTSLHSKLNTLAQPCVHIFTGKMFSRFVSELKSRKFTDSAKAVLEDPDELPTVFIRQADGNTVLADVFLPRSFRADESRFKVEGQILDEHSLKEIIKSVWINFLVVFPTPADAKRISGLSRDEVVCAVVEGVQEDKDTCYISSQNKVDADSMKEAYLRARDSLTDCKKSFLVYVRIVRSSTLPAKEVFVCGTLPTKVDADVYHTLNCKACQVMHNQASRYRHVLQWYDRMSKQGIDTISRLPSPSKVMRSEKRELALSPLVSTPVRTRTQRAGLSTSSLTSAESTQNDPIVRSLFGQ